MDILAAAGPTATPNKVAMAAGTTSTLSNTGTTTFTIKGKAYTKAAMTNAVTPTVDAGSGKPFRGVKANQVSTFLIGFSSSGALLCTQGQVLDVNPVTGAVMTAPQMGAIPSDFCPVASLTIKADATANNTTGWIFGTSNMAGVTGITYTFTDMMGLPDRPQA